MLEQTQRARKATKAIFLVCGLGISSWAPMVPYVKDHLKLNNADLGMLLLLLGAGAITMMPVSGILAHRYGTRMVIRAAAAIMALLLPVLVLIFSPTWMGIAIFLFGAAVGTVDVAMNSHGVQVQNSSGKPIMSSLHGLFSVGGLLGSLGLGFLMKLGLDPSSAAAGISLLIIMILAWGYPLLFDVNTEKRLIKEFSPEVSKEKPKGITWLNGSVIFLGLMCFSVFLSEGAMLDWSAIFLRENKGIHPEMTGVGYASFSIAMAAMRLLGDKIVSHLSGKTVVIGGSIIAACGLFLAILTPWVATSLIGFVLLGIGAANIVPVFFSEGGRLKNVPATISIPAISTMGYAGQLAGPALLGFIAFHFSLNGAFAFIGVLMLAVAVAYGLTSKLIS
jgi:predicted MFS family arabinose efflux permease